MFENINLTMLSEGVYEVALGLYFGGIYLSHITAEAVNRLLLVAMLACQIVL